MSGTFTWRQHTSIRFSTEAMKVEVANEFRVYRVDKGYYIGNAHLFYVPPEAIKIYCEELAGIDANSDSPLINVFSEDSDQLERIRHPAELRVYPTTRSFEGLKIFHLVVGYEIPLPLDLLKKNFTIPVKLTYFLRSYMDNLGCGLVETLNRSIISIYPPPDCKWDIDKYKPQDHLITQQGFAVDDGLCSSAATEIKIGFLLDEESFLVRDSVDISITLPVTQDIETIQARVDSANKTFEDRPGTLVVVFVCDLKGSSAETKDGKAPAALLRFRNIWKRSDVKPFRLMNIIGDMALVVCDPESFMQEGLAEITRLYASVLDLNFPVRGGFHIGLAETTGNKIVGQMVGYAIGEEFLGDAINQGAKAGDYKDNEGGLLATEEFVDWFKKSGDEDAFTFWEKHTFGAWETSLYRVDMGALQGSVHEKPTENSVNPVGFSDRIVARANKLRSRLIVGLDPDMNKFPLFLQRRWKDRPTPDNLAEIIFSFNKTVIEATKNLAVAYKPQAAFYEQYGIAGIDALQRTVCFLREQDLLVILDAKRNDIAHTAGAYAEAWLSSKSRLTSTPNLWQVDAITINGYLGKDGIDPFLAANPASGLFVLAKTSNPSSADLQDLKLDDGKTTVCEKMAMLAQEWGLGEVGESGYSRLGLVVGATYPEVTKRLRELAPKALFLMPGVGAQGGPLESIVAGAGANKLGAYIASSRSVLYGFELNETENADWATKVAKAAAKEAADLNAAVVKALEL